MLFTPWHAAGHLLCGYTEREVAEHMPALALICALQRVADGASPARTPLGRSAVGRPPYRSIRRATKNKTWYHLLTIELKHYRKRFVGVIMVSVVRS